MFCFMLSRLISGLGNAVHITAICWYIFTISKNGAITTLVLVFYFIPRVFLAPLGGILADYFPRRKLMIYADCIRASLVLVMPSLIKSNAIGFYA